MQILALKDKVLGFWRSYEDLNRLVLSIAWRSLGVLFAAYICASIVSAVTLMFLSGASMQHRFKPRQEVDRPRLSKDTNYRDLRKVILARNVFNSTGALPEEADPTTEGGAGATFNPNDKCQKPTVNVELLGIIHTGNAESSLATMQEKGYTIADVYRAGDRIIGNEAALIHAIEEGKVVLNNNGVKECLEINSLLTSNKPSTSPALPAASAVPNVSAAPDSAQAGDCVTTTVSLQSSLVEESLGPGFSKILEQGRLVPYHRDNMMVGFKLIGVKGGSLWSQVHLGSGDVITAVNGTSMAQPEKGFAVYEALQSDKQIRVEYLKGGKTPCIQNVEIK
jgi:general secretion pathway protein C